MQASPDGTHAILGRSGGQQEDAGSVSDTTKGVLLAISSSVFIGSSFVIKKQALRKVTGRKARAPRLCSALLSRQRLSPDPQKIRASAPINTHAAGDGGFGYLREPTWWLGMVTMVAGELANFAAYAFAAAIVVTPLGALSIIVSAVLSHNEPDEKLNVLGFLGCGLCILGGVIIVLHAPQEQPIESVQEVSAAPTPRRCPLFESRPAASALRAPSRARGDWSNARRVLRRWRSSRRSPPLRCTPPSRRASRSGCSPWACAGARICFFTSILLSAVSPEALQYSRARPSPSRSSSPRRVPTNLGTGRHTFSRWCALCGVSARECLLQCPAWACVLENATW